MLINVREEKRELVSWNMWKEHEREEKGGGQDTDRERKGLGK